MKVSEQIQTSKTTSSNLTCTEYFAKDCLVTGQEQACCRISWLFVCLFAVWNKSHGWWQLLFLYSSTICGQRNLTFGFIVVSLTMLLLFVFVPSILLSTFCLSLFFSSKLLLVLQQLNAASIIYVYCDQYWTHSAISDNAVYVILELSVCNFRSSDFYALNQQNMLFSVLW